MIQKLLVATHNKGKVKEFSEMLADLELSWLSLDDIGVTTDVEETGQTFKENAILKAQTYAQETGFLTLADDSGLEVDVLNGDPGVFTARYGGEDLTARERYLYLLDQLNLLGLPEKEWIARFRCTIVLAAPDGKILGSANGVCEGQISPTPIGDNGFGYDPVFYLPSHEKTMAQLPQSVKHQISHRGRAMQAIEPLLRDVLGKKR